jgi:hypothetical protein
VPCAAPAWVVYWLREGRRPAGRGGAAAAGPADALAQLDHNSFYLGRKKTHVRKSFGEEWRGAVTSITTLLKSMLHNFISVYIQNQNFA